MNELFTGLFDDAALFPPGNAPMDAAVPAHLAHRRAWYADMVGPFVCPDTRLADLGRLPGPVPVAVLVTGGPSAAALQGLTADQLAAVEIPAGPDPAATVAAALTLASGAPVFVEVPWDSTQTSVQDSLAGTGVHAKLRTGGTSAAAFPTERQLAAAIAGCLRRDVAFKCTAGLHHAVRHTAGDTGFEHHGFLNVLLATAALLDAATVAAAAEVLAERSHRALADAVRRLTIDRIAHLRTRFRSFGTCSITEPLDDLASLGLLDATERTEIA